MNPYGCTRQCDCNHPSECIFKQTAPERPSFAVVWIVGAIAVAAMVVVVLILV
ncbi:hypothetical protein Mycsm_02666 [Mycobacterium sp. JS623]|uniref:hypothetical protein n=1 Tax=Mycobacterium sp. JS623 TaxID=212767 RepID=UPI0002A567BF|nr:hypothetical protein [Mycobacterium sp. JS623]AGB22999.1 hypothetical protein Mycsm_02666 [Mycobacterium sp. JS623]